MKVEELNKNEKMKETEGRERRKCNLNEKSKDVRRERMKMIRRKKERKKERRRPCSAPVGEETNNI
jgi:hypothetical protein